ncbi:MAG TPA: hypothetical protein VKV28_17670 [Candidatus Binataceae bacterium]|nr:hypothetical protein [Candidatus Binataceae bacterium]
MANELVGKARWSKGLSLALFLYALSLVLALVCLVHTTALTMTGFFVFGLGALALGFVIYAKVVWDDLRAHGVL